MIRVNPRQASLRPPEITSFQILAPVGVGWGWSPERAPGQAMATRGLQKDWTRTGKGSSPSCHHCCRTEPEGTLGFIPCLLPQGWARYQVPWSLPVCPAQAQDTLLCSLAPNLKLCLCSPSALPPCSISPVFSTVPRQSPAPQSPPELWQELAVPPTLSPSLRAEQLIPAGDQGSDRHPPLLIINRESGTYSPFFLSDTPSLHQYHPNRPSKCSSTINHLLMM